MDMENEWTAEELVAIKYTRKEVERLIGRSFVLNIKVEKIAPYKSDEIELKRRLTGYEDPFCFGELWTRILGLSVFFDIIITPESREQKRDTVFHELGHVIDFCKRIKKLGGIHSSLGRNWHSRSWNSKRAYIGSYHSIEARADKYAKELKFFAEKGCKNAA